MKNVHAFLLFSKFTKNNDTSYFLTIISKKSKKGIGEYVKVDVCILDVM